MSTTEGTNAQGAAFLGAVLGAVLGALLGHWLIGAFVGGIGGLCWWAAGDRSEGSSAPEDGGYGPPAGREDDDGYPCGVPGCSERHASASEASSHGRMYWA
jgi:hypothetical protein